MKTQLSPHRQAGNIMVTCLITCAILGIILASYLIVIQSQSLSITRSQAWNATMAVAEAGVEEALSHLNRHAPFFDPELATRNLEANNWIEHDDSYQAPRRYLGDDAFYDVTIMLNGSRPIINSTGYVSTARSVAANPVTSFASFGYSPDRSRYQRREVIVNTKIDPLFAVAIAAEGTIDLSGNNIMTDSYDSSDPNYSDNGRYPIGQPTKIKKNGDVCSNATILDSIQVGNASINGKAKTGPSGTVHVGKNGYVSGGIDDDFNVVFPQVALPQTSWWNANTGSYRVNDKEYKHQILTSGDYYLNNLAGSLYIGTNANVRLLLLGDTKLTGSEEEIRIAPGAKLTLYVHSPSFSMGGKGVVNRTGKAGNFYYYGTPRNTAVTFGGNASFTGTIYAPDADFHLGGGGSDTYDFVGASVTKTVKMNGHFNFHYDEDLRKIGPSRGFVATRWQES